jgi:predicted nucleic acid-binding Zn ribbon protein
VTGRGEASLNRLIEGVLADLDLRTRFREHLAISSWPQIAGQVVSGHTQAEAVRDGVLIVATDTSAWANELQMRRRELLELLAAKIGSGVIRDIHFRAGARRRGRRAKQPVPRPSEVRLSGRQEKRIAEAAGKIEDEELRRGAERAFTALAKISEWRRRGGWRRCRRCGQWQRVGRRWCASCTYSGRRRRRR